MNLSHLYRAARLAVWAALVLSQARAVELRFLNWQGDDQSLKYLNRGKAVTVRADENSLSQPYAYDGADTLELFKERTAEDGRTVHEPAARLAIPKDATHLIVVLVARDADARSYDALAVDDAPASRPAGTIRLLNLSRMYVAFRINASDFTVAPGGSHQLSVDGAVQRVHAQAAARVGGDRWELVANNPLPVRAGLRVLLVLRDGRPQPGSKTNLVDMLSFYDRPPLPAKGAVAAAR